MTPRPTRRDFLTTGGTAALLPLAGCLVPFGTAETESIDVTIENQTDEEHTVTVLITLDDRALLDETATVDPETSHGTSFENPEDSGTTTVSASTEGGRSTEKAVNVGRGTGILFIDIIIEPDGLTIQAAAT